MEYYKAYDDRYRQIHGKGLSWASDEKTLIVLDFLSRYGIGKRDSILEIGCGEGGNLLPFAEQGCAVTGLDLNGEKIEAARKFFAKRGLEGDFSSADFLTAESAGERYDIILVHDVIEHIEPPGKEAFFARTRLLLKPDGIAFFGFPAWQMPFGGHQQTCRSRFCSHFPFLHLLPEKAYAAVLRKAGEDEARVGELMSIRRSRMTPERFESLSAGAGFRVLDRILWLVNPHYKAKFGLRPLRLGPVMRHIPYLRNFFTTSCFYILAADA